MISALRAVLVGMKALHAAFCHAFQAALQMDIERQKADLYRRLVWDDSYTWARFDEALDDVMKKAGVEVYEAYGRRPMAMHGAQRVHVYALGGRRNGAALKTDLDKAGVPAWIPVYVHRSVTRRDHDAAVALYMLKNMAPP
mgnify:FL=1